MTAEIQHKIPLNVLLVGQPNVGKSCLLNALVGPHVTISNYPGTTVEITRAGAEFDGTSFVFIDSPGIYSLSEQGDDEKATKDALLGGDVTVAVIVVDACSLERGLYFALQVLETGIVAVIAVNFVEDAAEKGIVIDYDRFSQIVGVPVIPFNPFTKRGVSSLVSEVLNASKSESDAIDVLYDDHIENAISMLIHEGLHTSLPERFVALRILEEDEEFQSVVDEGILKQIRNEMHADHPSVAEDISRMRYGTASFIAAEVTTIFHRTRRAKEVTASLRADQLLLHRFWGPVFTLLFFGLLFYFLMVVGGTIEMLLMELSEDLIAQIQGDGSVLTQILVDSLTGVTAGIAVALPYVFLFYVILGLTEDIGLLPRFVVNVQRGLRYFRIPERGFINLMLGLGCTVPAVASTRIISGQSQRARIIFLYAFVPCSSRMGIILGIVAFYGGYELVLLLFATLAATALLCLLVIKNISKEALDPILLELPTYRVPMVRNVAHKSWLRLKEFVVVVIPLLILGGVAYSLISQLGVTEVLVNPLRFITEDMWGLPGETIIPILFGFVQKDLTGAMLVSVLGSNIAGAMTEVQLLTFGIVTTIGVPCMIVPPAMGKEIGWKNAFIILVSAALISLIVGSTVWRIAPLLGFT